MFFDLSGEKDEEEGREDCGNNCDNKLTSAGQKGFCYTSFLSSSTIKIVEEKRKEIQGKEVEKQRKKVTQKQVIGSSSTLSFMEEQQRQGRFKTEETTLVLPEELYQSKLGAAILSHMLFSSEGDAKSYGCLSAPCSIPGLCRWTFRNYLDGGNASVGDVGTTVIPFIVIVYPPLRFLELVDESRDGIEFPALENEVNELRENMRSHESCGLTYKLVFLLIDVDNHCKQYSQDLRKRKAKKGSSRKATWSVKLDEAAAFLLYTANIDIVLRDSKGDFKEVAKYFETVTRCLGEQASHQMPTTSLSNVKRINFKKNDEVLTAKGNRNPQIQAIFGAMLQAIPGMSQAKAKNLMKHYPCPQHLLEALNDSNLSLDERRKLLSDKLDPKRNNYKLAALIHKAFTSEDPMELL